MTRAPWMVLPRGWRAPAFSVRHSRSWGFAVSVTVVAAGFAVALAFHAPSQASFAIVLHAVLTALSMTRGLVADDRTRGRWVILFQRAATPSEHYARSALLAYAATVGLLLAAWTPYAVAGVVAKIGARELLGTFAGALSYATVVFAVGAGMSALARRNDSQLVALLLFVSYVQIAVERALGVPLAAQHVVRWLLMPVDAMQSAYQWFAAPRGDFAATAAWHLLGYTTAFLALGALRLRQLGSGDVTSITVE